MEPIRPAYRRREMQRQDHTLLLIITIIAAPVFMILVLFAHSQLRSSVPETTPTSQAVSGQQSRRAITPVPTVVSRPMAPSRPDRNTPQVEFYSHPAPAPTLTVKQRYDRASEIYRSMGSGSSSPVRSTPRPTPRPQLDHSYECARLARDKARIESVMRSGYTAGSSQRLHNDLNRIVKRMQVLHCLR